jgi:hypothetical protein
MGLQGLLTGIALPFYLTYLIQGTHLPQLSLLLTASSFHQPSLQLPPFTSHHSVYSPYCSPGPFIPPLGYLCHFSPISSLCTLQLILDPHSSTPLPSSPGYLWAPILDYI